MILFSHIILQRLTVKSRTIITEAGYNLSEQLIIPNHSWHIMITSLVPPAVFLNTQQFV